MHRRQSVVAWQRILLARVQETGADGLLHQSTHFRETHLLLSQLDLLFFSPSSQLMGVWEMHDEGLLEREG